MRISDWSSDVCSSDLFGHIARDEHREHRQHLLEQPGVEPALRRGMARDGAANVLRSEDLAQYLVALPDRPRLRSQHRIEQPAAAQTGDQSAESLYAAALRPLLQTPENHGKTRARSLLRAPRRTTQAHRNPHATPRTR